MGEYSKFAIMHKLPEDRINFFRQIYEVQQKNGNIDEFLKKKGYDLWSFGLTEFFIVKNQVFYTFTPMDIRKQMNEQRVCKYNISSEWLLCFDYKEMKVVGEEVGVFKAMTTVNNALQRLKGIQYKVDNEESRKFNDKVKDIIYFLEFNANPQTDLLMLSSDSIYYSTDGEFNNQYVRQDINKKISSVKKLVYAKNWQKAK